MYSKRVLWLRRPHPALLPVLRRPSPPRAGPRPRFAPNVLGLMRRHNASRLFLMTHPLVWGVVSQRLRALGVEPLAMELGDVAHLAAGTGEHRTSSAQTFCHFCRLVGGHCSGGVK